MLNTIRNLVRSATHGWSWRPVSCSRRPLPQRPVIPTHYPVKTRHRQLGMPRLRFFTGLRPGHGRPGPGSLRLLRFIRYRW